METTMFSTHRAARRAPSIHGTQCKWRPGVIQRQLCREEETCPPSGATWFRRLYVTQGRHRAPWHFAMQHLSPRLRRTGLTRAAKAWVPMQPEKRDAALPNSEHKKRLPNVIQYRLLQ